MVLQQQQQQQEATQHQVAMAAYRLPSSPVVGENKTQDDCDNGANQENDRADEDGATPSVGSSSRFRRAKGLIVSHVQRQCFVLLIYHSSNER